MGILDLFRQAKPSEQKPNAVDYVEWLLLHMLQTSRTELTVDTARPLPGSAAGFPDAPPPCRPDPETVINRLKILSGITPVRQKDVTARGGFERPRAQHVIHFATEFRERDDRSTCTLKLSVKGAKNVH
jgi:hypothetical protein